MVVFKAFSLDIVRRSGLRTRLLTFQLRAVVSGVFKVFSQNRVQLRLLLRLWNAFLSGLWSRSLFLGLVKAFKIFAQDQVHSSSSHDPARVFEALDEAGEGGFSHFSPK